MHLIHSFPINSELNKMKKNNISFVVKNNLCAKCGICYSICPENAIEIIGEIDKVPTVNERCNSCKLCINACPGLKPIVNLEEDSPLGNYKSCYIGYSSDENIRYTSSSGGIITSLNISLLNEFYFDGIICIRQSKKNIYDNEVILASTKEDIITAQGSRYAPAYVCRSLKDLPIKKGGKYAFVGKPCDIQALIKYQRYNKNFNFFKIAIFCAHTPSMTATREIFVCNNIIDKKINKFDYRGHGWPGYFTAYSNTNEVVLQKEYPHVWGKILCKRKYINKRCFLCHDCTGENADISVGDAWLDEYIGNSIGHSIVITRSEESENIIQHNIRNKYLVLEKAEESKVLKSQRNLLSKKNNVYIKNVICRFIMEEVTEEQVIYKKSTNYIKNIPGLLKFLLLNKFKL